MITTKSSLVPPLVTAMNTTSYHTTPYNAPNREGTVTMSTEGDFADVVDSAERDRRHSRQISFVAQPATYTEFDDCILPESIVLPPSPVEGGSMQVPRVRLHFVRHAEAEHNASKKYGTPTPWKIFNPALTPLGQAQCEHLSKTFMHMDKITHILCSPLHRTLETCLRSFETLTNRGMKVIAWDILRELGDGPCNHGDPLSVLAEKVKGLPVNLALLKEGWETGEKIRYHTQRPKHMQCLAKELYSFCHTVVKGGIWNGIPLQAIDDGRDIEVLIVSHGNLLKSLTGRMYHNAEFRTFKFIGPAGEGPGVRKHHIVETSDSRNRKHEKLTVTEPITTLDPTDKTPRNRSLVFQKGPDTGEVDKQEIGPSVGARLAAQEHSLI